MSPYIMAHGSARMRRSARRERLFLSGGGSCVRYSDGRTDGRTTLINITAAAPNVAPPPLGCSTLIGGAFA